MVRVVKRVGGEGTVLKLRDELIVSHAAPPWFYRSGGSCKQLRPWRIQSVLRRQTRREASAELRRSQKRKAVGSRRPGLQVAPEIKARRLFRFRQVPGGSTVENRLRSNGESSRAKTQSELIPTRRPGPVSIAILQSKAS